MLLWFSWYIMQSHTSSVMLPLVTGCFGSPNIALPCPGGPSQGWSDLGWCLHGSAAAQPHSCLHCFSAASAASAFCSWGPLISGGLGSLVTCSGGGCGGCQRSLCDHEFLLFAAGRTCPSVFSVDIQFYAAQASIQPRPTYRLTGWSSAQLESSGLCKPAEATKS